MFDGGKKKICRAHQYFGVKAAQEHVRRREGGIIWHAQGSGKSLVMVWLTKWILSRLPAARVLIITDRTELDEQIEKVFLGVDEKIVRTTTWSAGPGCHGGSTDLSMRFGVVCQRILSPGGIFTSTSMNATAPNRVSSTGR